MVKIPANKEWSKGEGTIDWSQIVTPRAPRPEIGSGDNQPVSPHTRPMNDITREELNALLENHQLKADARLKEFESRVADGLLKMDHSLQLLDKDLSGVRGLKGTIILNSVLSVIAIVGITIAVMAYGVANFDSGRDTSAALQEMKQQSFETRQLLEQVKAQQEAPQAAQ